jgi:L,D-peptidoglycan transpeptidase YkuD (ErfK/YbiS/YcfS/YnhG family)
VGPVGLCLWLTVVVFSIASAFGRQPDPGAGVPYLHMETSDWWVSDVHGPAYYTHQRCAPGTVIALC